MDQAKDNALVRVVNDIEFDGQHLTAIEVEGTVYWSAAQLGRVLGYDHSNILPTMVHREWSTEFLPDIDTAYLSGASLRAVKATVPGFVGKNSPKLLVLTESGVNLVLMKTDKPAGVALRRKLATEVLPAIRRTGSYVPEAQAGGGDEPPKLPPTPKAKALPGPVSPSKAAILREELATLNVKRRAALGTAVMWSSVEVLDAVEGLLSIIPDSKLESSYRDTPAQRAAALRAMLADAPPDVRATLDRFLGGELRAAS